MVDRFDICTWATRHILYSIYKLFRMSHLQLISPQTFTVCHHLLFSNMCTQLLPPTLFWRTFLIFGTLKCFTSASKVNMSIKVCVTFKQAMSWQHYNHLCVFLVPLHNINMSKPRVLVNLFDLWPLCVLQTTNKCSWVGGLKAGSHRFWLTEQRLPRATEWVNWLVFSTHDLQRHFSVFSTLSVTIIGHTQCRLMSKGINPLTSICVSYNVEFIGKKYDTVKCGVQAVASILWTGMG